MKKKILVINGSPRAKGNTETLSDALLKGAAENGHEVKRIDIRKLKINGCIGCFGCQMGKGKARANENHPSLLEDGRMQPRLDKVNPCVQKDDMNEVYEAYREADVVVWASPVYWQGMTGQLKIVIDRLFALAGENLPKKDTALLGAATTDGDWIYGLFADYYQTMFVKTMGWKDLGMVLATGVNDRGAVKDTDFVQKAYELGKSI